MAQESQNGPQHQKFGAGVGLGYDKGQKVDQTKQKAVWAEL